MSRLRRAWRLQLRAFLSAAFVTLLSASPAVSASPAAAAAPALAAGSVTVASVAAALKNSPVYIDPATQSGASAAGLAVDAARLTPVVPVGVHVAVLLASFVPADTDPTELPALLSSRIGQGGTFILLIDGHLYGASTTLPGQLADDLATAQAELPKSGDATPALIGLVRTLFGAGDLQDAASPVRAGGPIGVALLVVIVVVVVFGGLALWWWLRRKPRARRPSRPAPVRDLVEIDYEGNVIRRTPADERESTP